MNWASLLDLWTLNLEELPSIEITARSNIWCTISQVFIRNSLLLYYILNKISEVVKMGDPCESSLAANSDDDQASGEYLVNYILNFARFEGLGKYI